VIPHDQRHLGEAAALVNLFRAQGTEISVAGGDFSTKEAPRPVDLGSNLAPRDSGGVARLPGDTAPTPPARPSIQVHKGDWIVRMDQPYTGTVRTLLATQKFGSNEPPPYDDTGWTLDLLRHVIVRPVADSSVLAQPMTRLDADAVVTGTTSGEGSTLVVRNTGDWRAAALPWKIKGARFAVADTAFSVGDQQFPAGTFLVEGATANAVSALGLNAVAASPNVKRHAVTLPRVALLHTWIETQNEGWVRFAFDQMGIAYTSISDQGLSKPGALDKFDVVVFPHVGGPMTAVLNGRPMVGPPVPWKKTPATPDLGLWDATDDVRPGMGLAGAAALEAFVQRGGLLITEGSTSALVSALGFSRTVQVVERRALRAQGSIVRVQEVAKQSPLLYGYDDAASFPAYFGGDPVLSVVPRDTLEVTADVDSTVLRQAEVQRAKVILRYYPKPDSLLLSGLMAGGPELIGKAALVDAPVGKGHLVLFGIRPLWRWESQGTFAIVLNAMANWDHLTQSP
jgi:hypothetical protein